MKLLVFTDILSREQTFLTYACDLAASINGSLHVLHVVDRHAAHDSLLETEKTPDAIWFLEKFQHNVRVGYGIDRSFEIRFGSVDEVVISVGRETRADLIIMKADRIEGATLVSETISRVSRASRAPVLVVPATSVFSPLNKIVLATNEFSNGLSDLEILTPLLTMFQARVVAVHIVNRFGDEDSELEETRTSVRRRSESLKAKPAYHAMHFEEYQHTDLMEGISTFIGEESAAALAVSVDNNTLFERLAGRNLTRESPYWVDVPIVLMHDQRIRTSEKGLLA